MHSSTSQMPSSSSEFGLLSKLGRALPDSGRAAADLGPEGAPEFVNELHKSMSETVESDQQPTDLKGFSRNSSLSSSEQEETPAFAHTSAIPANESAAAKRLAWSEGKQGTQLLNQQKQIATTQQSNSRSAADSPRTLSGETAPLSGKPLPLSASEIPGLLKPADLASKNTTADAGLIQSNNGLEPNLISPPKFKELENGSHSFDRFNQSEFGVVARELPSRSEISERFVEVMNLRSMQASDKEFASSVFTLNSQLTSESGASTMTPATSNPSIATTISGYQTSASISESAARQLQIIEPLNQLSNGETQKSAGSDSVYRDQITTAYGNNKWMSDFAGKIRIMTQSNFSVAELNLNPADLGAIEIRIQTLDEGALVNFFTSNSATKEIIDESLPRLRELLADSGISLQQSDVSDQREKQNVQREGISEWNSDSEQHNTTPEIVLNKQRTVSTSLIDHYV